MYSRHAYLLPHPLTRLHLLLPGSGQLLHVCLCAVIRDGSDASCESLQGQQRLLGVARLNRTVDGTDGLRHCTMHTPT